MRIQKLCATSRAKKRALTLVTSVAVALTLTACSDQNEVVDEKPLRPVRTMTVYAPDLTRTQTFPAVVDASRKADLSFRVSGEITKFPVNEGQPVKAGDVIAKLDDRDYAIQRNEAQSLFDKAQSDYNRAKNLMTTNAISRADFDQLKAQLDSAQARLDTAENSLAYTELTASFDGVIARKLTDNFQEIQAGTPVVSLQDLSNIYLKIDLPESIMIRVRRDTAPGKLFAEFDAIAGTRFPLTFKEVATQADEVTKTYQVTLSMPAPENNMILPGMTANVTAERLIADDSTEAAFHLPANVVMKDTKGNYVFVVEQVSKGVGKVSRRSVNAGAITELGLEIFSGIQQGDVVLTAGMSKVTDGMQVKY